MNVIPNSLEIFTGLKDDQDNNKCFECQSPNPLFTSVNHGCFICTNCVCLHLPLGPTVSKVKAIEDEWEEEDLKLMIAGGNSSLQEYFLHYGLAGSDPNFKYLTKAALFYREMLAVVAQDKEYEENCPNIEEGVQLYKMQYPELGAICKEEEKKEGSWMKNLYYKTVIGTSNAIDKAFGKIDKFADTPGLRKIEKKTIDFANVFESKLTDVVNGVYSKPRVQDALEKMGKAAEKIREKWNNRK